MFLTTITYDKGRTHVTIGQEDLGHSTPEPKSSPLCTRAWADPVSFVHWMVWLGWAS